MKYVGLCMLIILQWTFKQIVGKQGTYAHPDRYQSRDPKGMYTFFPDMQGESEKSTTGRVLFFERSMPH